MVDSHVAYRLGLPLNYSPYWTWEQIWIQERPGENHCDHSVPVDLENESRTAFQ